MSGFVGIEVLPEKERKEGSDPCIMQLDAPMRITMVALGAELKNPTGRSSLLVTVNESTTPVVLCNLVAGKVEQQTLDVVFGEDEVVEFKCTGDNAMYLSGYYVDTLMGQDGYDDEDDEEEDDIPYGYAMSKNSEDEEIDSDEEVGSEEEEVMMAGESKFTEVSPEEEAKLNKKSSNHDTQVEKMDEDKQEDQEDNEEGEGDEDIGDDDEDQDDDEDEVEEEGDDEEAPDAIPISKKPENKKRPANEENSPKTGQPTKAPKASPDATPVKSAEQTINSESKKKTLPSGLVIEEVKAGQGARAKNGKTVFMRYIGKLMNGKEFDANRSGKPFVFTLGKGQVIKGWDIGIQGMQVGGVRRLTIPAALAYGTRGSPPAIPKNATLKFDLKLLDVK